MWANSNFSYEFWDRIKIFTWILEVDFIFRANLFETQVQWGDRLKYHICGCGVGPNAIRCASIARNVSNTVQENCKNKKMRDTMQEKSDSIN